MSPGPVAPSATGTTAAASATRGARRRARTHQALLDAARQVVGERGIDAATIGEIVERADVGFGSFYNHFESKDGLVDALAADAIATHTALVDEVNAAFSRPVERLANGVWSLVHLAAADPLWGRLVLRLGTGRLDLAAPLLSRLERDLRDGQAAGQLAPDDLGVVMAAVSGGVMAVIAGRLAGALDEDAEWAFAETVLRTAGMAPAAARTTVARVRTRRHPSPGGR